MLLDSYVGTVDVALSEVSDACERDVSPTADTIVPASLAEAADAVSTAAPGTTVLLANGTYTQHLGYNAGCMRS